MRYDKLTHPQKQIVTKLEYFYLNNLTVSRVDYVIALAFLLNKYKAEK